MVKITLTKKSYIILAAGLLIAACISVLLFSLFTNNTKTVSKDMNAQDIIAITKEVLDAKSILYNDSPFRYHQQPGDYMRPWETEVTGTTQRVFPSEARLLQLEPTDSSITAIDKLLMPVFTKSDIKDKSLKIGREYASENTICYLEVPKVDSAWVFGCADVLNYRQVALATAPLDKLYIYGNTGAYGTPITRDNPTGNAGTLLPMTFSPGTEDREHDTMERYGLSTVLIAFYKTPTSLDWVYYGNFQTKKLLCSSTSMRSVDIQQSFDSICKDTSIPNS